MKSFFKKIALVLVLAMVVTMLPAKAVSAAEADGPQMYGTLRLYIDGDATGTYSDSAYAKVWNKGDYAVEFSTDNEEVAIVGKRKGLVTAVGVGTANITATFTDASGNTLTKTCKVTVKRNAVTAGISEKSESKVKELKVGEEFQLVATRTTSDGKVVKSGRTVITDGMRFTSDNEEIFKVGYKKGMITAVNAGSATLKVWAVQTEQATRDENDEIVEYYRTTPVAEYEVTVVEGEAVVTGVTVKSVTGLELAVTGVTAENVGTLKITNVNGGDITSLFSEPKLSEDGKTVTVTKYINLLNDEELTFAFGDGNGFTYTIKVGEAVGIVIDGPDAVVVGEATDIKYRVVDANGIDLGITSGVVLDVNDKTYAMVSGNKITMYQIGKTVTLTATYTTGKLDANYMPIQFKAEKTVTCIEQPAVTASAVTFMIGEFPNGFNKDNLTADGLTMYKGQTDRRLFAQVALSAGDPVNNSDIAANGFTFEALTPSVLLVEARTGYLTPVNVGTARILVKYDNGYGITITGVATIYVREDTKVVSIAPDKNGVVLSNAVDVNESVTITINGTDQYGNGKDPNVSHEAVSWEGMNANPAVEKATVEAYMTASGKTVTFNAVNNGVPVPAGTYVYRIKDGDATTIVNVIVRAPEAAVSYKILVDGNKDKLEIEPKDDIATSDATKISFRIVGVDRYGVASKVIMDADPAKISVKVNDENKADVIPGENGKYTASFVAETHASAVSGDAVIVTTGDSEVGYTIKTGTFVISATYDNRTVVPANVAVSIAKTTAPEVKIPTTVISNAKVTDNDYQRKVEALFEVDRTKYEAPYIVWDSGDVVNPITANAKGQSYIFVKNIKVYERINDVLVLHTVAVNRYISVTIQ